MHSEGGDKKVITKNQIKMVDITDKQPTTRIAVSKGKIYFSKEVYNCIKNKTLSKGDPINVAKIAGILAVKKVPFVIPLTHHINVTYCDIDFKLKPLKNKGVIEVVSTVKTFGKTGPDIESLYTTMVSLLTIYDMVKPIDPKAKITDIYLVSKTGGKSSSL